VNAARALGPRAAGVAVALLVTLGVPAVASAHGLSATYQSPLPLAVYLVGAATTVALSFLFVLARDMRAAPPEPGLVVSVPAWLRILLRIVGVIGWVWIVAQGIAGGSSDGAVAPIFLWIYGWVGLAVVSALVFPIWEWLDPFTTFHDAGAWVLRRLGVEGWAPSLLPDGLRLWPAVGGFVFFVWLELVLVPGVNSLTIVLVAYTVIVLALMALFGRDEWRASGETFSVWFRTLNRLAPFGVVPSDDEDRSPDAIDEGKAIRRSFAAGLLDGPWETARVALVATATASIIFDGGSQTVAFAAVFGAPAMGPKTLILLAWLAIVVFGALGVARLVSPGAIGAGLLPIAVGYLIAHYLTYLLVDGQRILIAISDPLQQGQNLFGTAFFEPSPTFLPPGLVWTVQLAAVVGGHMLGAWAGHARAQRELEAAAAARGARDLRHRRIKTETAAPRTDLRVREVPLAVLMVCLTTLTLWSLGQGIVAEPAPSGAVPSIAVTRPL
jgi:hypothetical protein